MPQVLILIYVFLESIRSASSHYITLELGGRYSWWREDVNGAPPPPKQIRWVTRTTVAYETTMKMAMCKFTKSVSIHPYFGLDCKNLTN